MSIGVHLWLEHFPNAGGQPFGAEGGEPDETGGKSGLGDILSIKPFASAWAPLNSTPSFSHANTSATGL